MSTEAAKPADSKDAKPAADAAAPAAAKKPSAIGGVLKIVLTAALAGGAAYGGSLKGAAAHPIIVQGGHGGDGEEHGEKKHEAGPPGPTLPLDAFLLSVYDTSKKAHPMKLSIAVEFGAQKGEHGELKDFIPRIRDGILSYLRTVTYEQVTDATTVDKIRADLLERCKAAGATGAQRVLVTDFVVQ